MGLGTWDLGLGTWVLGLGSWDLGLGTWVLGLGSWDLGLGRTFVFPQHFSKMAKERAYHLGSWASDLELGWTFVFPQHFLKTAKEQAYHLGSGASDLKRPNCTPQWTGRPQAYCTYIYISGRLFAREFSADCRKALRARGLGGQKSGKPFDRRTSRFAPRKSRPIRPTFAERKATKAAKATGATENGKRDKGYRYACFRHPHINPATAIMAEQFNRGEFDKPGDRATTGNFPRVEKCRFTSCRPIASLVPAPPSSIIRFLSYCSIPNLKKSDVSFTAFLNDESISTALSKSSRASSLIPAWALLTPLP